MERLLIVSDSPRELAPVQQALIRAGFAAVTSPALEVEMERALAGRPADVCLVDAAHSRLSPGRVRHHLSHTRHLNPLLLVLVPEERLSDLMEARSADDFLLPPYRPAELLARVRLLLSRANRAAPTHLIRIGDLVIDQSNYQVQVAGRRIEMTFKEYELLRFLAAHRGQVFTRDAILTHVWGYDYFGGVRTVDVHVRRVRAKLGSPTDLLLETVRNVGYRFVNSPDYPREGESERS